MADFDVRGSVSIQVTDAVRDLDRLQTSLRGAVAEVNRLDHALDDLSGRRVQITVDLDIQGNQKLDMLWDQLEAMSSHNWEIRVTVDADQAFTRILGLEVILNRISTDPVNIDIDVQTAGAMANLAQLQSQLMLMTTMSHNIDVDVNRDMDSVSRAMGGAARGAEGLGMSFTGLLGPLAVLATAIIPVVVALSGLAAGMLGAFSAVGVGIAAFATFAIPTFSKITKGAEDLKKAQEELKNATTAEQIKKALEDQKKVLEGLTPLQMKAIQNLNAFKETYQQLAKALEPTVYKIFADALNVAQTGMFNLAVVAKPAGDAIDGVLKKMNAGLQNDSWQKFFEYMRENVGYFIDTWLTGFGNIITAIANMIVAFDPLSKSVSGGFLSMSERFLEWSKHLDTNKAFQNWIAYVKREGPGMWQTLKDILGTLKDLAEALAPIGLKVLNTLGKLAEWTNGLKESNPEMYQLVTNFAAFALVLSPLLGPLAALVGLLVTVGPLAFGIAGIFVGLAAALGILYFKNEDFRKSVNELATQAFEKLKKVWDEIKEVFDRVWPGIVAMWKIYGDSILQFAKDTWETVKLLIKGAFDVIAGLLKVFVGLFSGDWGMLWEGVKQTLEGVGELLVGILKLIVDRLTLIINLFLDWISAAFTEPMKKVGSAFKDGWDKAYETVEGWIKDVGDGLETFFVDLPYKAYRWIISMGQEIGKALASAAMSFVWWGVDILLKIGNINLFDAGMKLIQGLWDGIKNKFESMMNWVKDKLGDFAGLFPHSPAKWGPFSGKGYTTYSGAALITDFRKGMEFSAPALYSSASSIMQRVNMGGGMMPIGVAVGAMMTGNRNDVGLGNENRNNSQNGGIPDVVSALLNRPIYVTVDSQVVARATERGQKTLDRRR